MDEFDAMGMGGAFDPASLAFDVPMPTAADESLFEGVQATAALSAPIRVMDDPGSIMPGIELPADVGPSVPTPAPMAEEGASLALGGMPDIVPEAPDPFGGSLALDGGDAPESPAAFSVAPLAPPSDAPAASEGFGLSLGGLPGIGLPASPEAPFAGVSMAPEEAFDLQLALAPPEPSQEGFAAASDAPLSASVGAYASTPNDFQSIGHLRQMDAISTQLFGPLGGAADPGSAARPSGSSVVIQNLHLPGARAGDVLSDLLSMSTGTEADLSGLGV